jgi:hypothetical protein
LSTRSPANQANGNPTNHGHNPKGLELPPNQPANYPYALNSPYLQTTPYEAAKLQTNLSSNYYLQTNHTQSTALNSPLSTIGSPVQNMLSLQSPMNNYVYNMSHVNPYHHQNPQMDMYNAQQAAYFNFHMMNNQMNSPSYYIGHPPLYANYMMNGVAHMGPQDINNNNHLKAPFSAYMANQPPPIIINNNIVNPDTKIQNNSLVSELEKQNDLESKRNIKEAAQEIFNSSRGPKERSDKHSKGIF